MKYFTLFLMLTSLNVSAEIIKNYKCYGAGKKETGNYDQLIDVLVFENYLMLKGNIYKRGYPESRYEDVIPFSKITNPVGSFKAAFEAYENFKTKKFCFDIDTTNDSFTGNLVPKN